MPDTLIYVAVYEHKYGTDTFVCASEAEALALREDLARESWSQELPDTPLPAAAVGEAYFAALAERWGDSEYFDIHRLACDLWRFHEAGPPPTTRLYIARYEHPHGTEVFACASEAEALALREDLARENWEQEMPGTPRPASAVGEAYFAALGERWGDNEYFEIVPVDCDLTRFTEAARPPPPPEAEPEGAELAALKAQYAARGLLLFRPGDAGAPGGARWALTRTARLSGLLYRDFATFRDVDFGVRLYADQERLAVPPA